MSKVTRRCFPETFKREVVERVATRGLSVSAVAGELDRGIVFEKPACFSG